MKQVTYDHRPGGIVVIYKRKKDLTAYEQVLVKYQPEKYIRKDPKKAKKKKDKRSRSERRKDKELKSIWKDFDEMQKNPKKFKKREKRHEKLLQRYVKQKDKKNKKLSKKDKLARKSAIAYLDARNKEIELDHMGLNTNNNNWFNPSQQFASSFYAPSAGVKPTDTKMSKLKMLEEEILNNVQGDLFEDHLIHQYYGGGSKQYKKDRKRHQKQIKKAQKRRKKVREVVVDASYVKSIIG